MQFVAHAPKPPRRSVSRGPRDDGRSGGAQVMTYRTRSTYGAMLRTAALWTAGVGALAAVAYAVLRGAPSALSCLAGVGFVAAMFASGMWGLRLVLRGAPHLAQAGAFAVFFLQMYVGILVAVAGRSAAWLDPSALAAGAIGATLVWQAGMVTGFATARRHVYSREDGAPAVGTDPSNSAGEGGRR